MTPHRQPNERTEQNYCDADICGDLIEDNGQLMSPSNSIRLSYAGTDSRGCARTGATVDTPARLAEAKFKQGWKSLRIREPGGIEIGGISYNADKGERVWWGER